MEVAEATEEFPWDSTIEASPWGCFSHLTGWLESLGALPEHRLHRLVFRKGREAVALCPLFTVHRGPLRAAYSPPYPGAAHHMGPVFLRPEVMASRKWALSLRDYQATFDAYVREVLGVNYVSLRYPPRFLDARPLQWAGYRVGLRYTYMLDLRQGPEEILQGCSADFRRNVRKCRERVTVHHEADGRLVPFEKLGRRQYRRIGVPYPLPPGFLERLFAALGADHAQLFTAEVSGEIQTGLVLLSQGNRATIWHGGFRAESSPLPVNDYLHWAVIQATAARGFEELEIMDADNPRMEESKTKLNPTLIPCLRAERGRPWHVLAERLGREPPSPF